MDGGAKQEKELLCTPSPKPLGKDFVITAYCACAKCCGQWADGMTASNTVATEGRTIAVDTSVISFGTNVYIDGVGERVAEDTGSGIQGNRIDLFFEDHQRALNFGVQTKEVTILN